MEVKLVAVSGKVFYSLLNNHILLRVPKKEFPIGKWRVLNFRELMQQFIPILSEPVNSSFDNIILKLQKQTKLANSFIGLSSYIRAPTLLNSRYNKQHPLLPSTVCGRDRMSVAWSKL